MILQPLIGSYAYADENKIENVVLMDTNNINEEVYNKNANINYFASMLTLEEGVTDQTSLVKNDFIEFAVSRRK